MVKENQSERTKSSGKYALCSDILPTLSPNLRLILCKKKKKKERGPGVYLDGRFCDKGYAADTFYVRFGGMPRVEVLTNTAQPNFIT